MNDVALCLLDCKMRTVSQTVEHGEHMTPHQYNSVQMTIVVDLPHEVHHVDSTRLFWMFSAQHGIPHSPLPL